MFSQAGCPVPSITIRDAGDLRRIASELRQVAGGKELRKELTGGIRNALKPVAAKAKAAYKGLPEGRSRGSRSREELGDLKDLLAKAVRLEVRTSGRQAGVRIRVDGRRMPSGLKSLPRLAEGEGHAVDSRGGRWRHPVFGDRETWVQQPTFPVFYRTVEPHRDEVGRAIDEVLDAVKRKLEHAR